MIKIMFTIQLLFVIAICYSIYDSNNKAKTIKYISERIINNEKDINNYRNVIAYFYKYDNQKIKNYFGRNEKGDSISLQFLLNKYKRLKVFEYKLTDCSNCVNAALDSLYLLKNKQNFLIISDYTSFPYMKYLKEKYGDFLLLRVEDLDNGGTPCFFQVDKDLKISSFLHISNNDKILPFYLKEINRKDSLDL